MLYIYTYTYIDAYVNLHVYTYIQAYTNLKQNLSLRNHKNFVHEVLIFLDLSAPSQPP